jgi:hypothetical protein
MTLLQLSREQNVDHIVDVLSAEFGDKLTTTRIAAEADRVYTQLVETSRVPAFVPILALRRTRAGLVKIG